MSTMVPGVDAPRTTSAQASSTSTGHGANIEALGTERGHRTFTVIRKGGKILA